MKSSLKHTLKTGDLTQQIGHLKDRTTSKEVVLVLLAGTTGFEPAISALTGPHVNRYTTPPAKIILSYPPYQSRYLYSWFFRRALEPVSSKSLILNRLKFTDFAHPEIFHQQHPHQGGGHQDRAESHSLAEVKGSRAA